MNRIEAVQALAMLAIADHCDIQWDASDVWERLTDLDGADVDDITEEACRIIRSVSECKERIEEAKRVLIEARNNPLPSEVADTRISDPVYFTAQRTIVQKIDELPLPLLESEVHDLAYSIADALNQAGVLITTEKESR